MHVYLPQYMQAYLLWAHFQTTRHMYLWVYVIFLKTFDVFVLPHHPNKGFFLEFREAE